MNLICNFEVGRCYQVEVTHINNPHSFYVRSAEISDHTMNKIEKPGDPVSAMKIQLGQRVIFKSNVFGKFMRGEIRFVNTNEEKSDYDIFAIDYGCFEQSILIEHIHSLNPQSEPENRCPALASHCRLHLCEPIGNDFTPNVIDTMKTYVGEHPATITVKNIMNDQLVVELKTVECPSDIAVMLGLIHLTTFTKGLYQVNRFRSSARGPSNLTQTLKFKHKNLEVGDTLHVRVQSGTSFDAFYVAEVNEFKKLISNQSFFSSYCKNRNMKDEDIVPGKLCAVKLGTPPTYERAMIKEILKPNSMALLHLVDWGTTVESQFSWIRSIDSEIYVTQPVVAIYCSTQESQVWKTNLPTFLFKGFQFVIKVMEIGSGFDTPHKVNIYPWKM